MARSSLLAAVQQYQRTHDKAVQMLGLFEDAEAPELLRLQKDLGEDAIKLLEMTGLDWGQCAGLGRHLTFLGRYLKRNEKENCAADIRDIVFHDLPATLKSIIAKISEDNHLDQRLRDAVYPLLDGEHNDSAIRKSFVILTERLRRAFGVREELDGEDLVNLVFGRGGRIPVQLDDGKKQALRNLISGFYGVYRNRYAHNNEEANAADAQAIVEMTNRMIIEIEEVSKASIKRVARKKAEAKAPARKR